MYILLAIVGFCLKIVGIVVGISGFAGLALTATDQESAWVEAGLVSVAGLTISAIGLLLFIWGIRQAGHTSRKVFLGIYAVLVGAYLAWFGLGIQGILTLLGLDSSGLFAYSSPHPIMWLMVVGGALLCICGVRLIIGKRVQYQT